MTRQNIIIASGSGLTYNDFLMHLAPLVVVVMIVFVGLCRWLFRSAFRYDPARAATIAQLRERDAIRDPRLLAISLAVLVMVTAAFVLHTALHLEPAVVAIVAGSSCSCCPGWIPQRWRGTSSGRP